MKFPSLHAHEFSAFLQSVHGPTKTLLAEQELFCRQLLDDERWPAEISVSPDGDRAVLIDVAVFALALQADRGAQRSAPLRIHWVGDRYAPFSVVEERAQFLAHRLMQARLADDASDLLARVAQRMSHLSAGLPPLQVHRVSGCTPERLDTVCSPCQPAIVFMGPGQLGSRLLFRGYGVSPALQPLHAGIVGADGLIVLDELSNPDPLQELLRWVAQCRRKAPSHYATPWSHVALTTAASGRSSETAVRLVLGRAPTSSVNGHPSALVDEAWRFASFKSPEKSARTIWLVVNHHALARSCNAQLAARISAHNVPAEVLFVCGRARLRQRESLAQRLAALRSEVHDKERVLFVVSTQCLEVGSGIKFDAVVTQIAPLGVLRLRFDHLRAGTNPERPRGVVHACPDEVSPEAIDPVYDKACTATWNRLMRHAVERGDATEGDIECSACVLPELVHEQGQEKALRPTPRQARLITDQHLELWVQTNPAPPLTPEVDGYIYGLCNTGDVQVIWRADLREQELRYSKSVERIKGLMSQLPPQANEGLALPVWAVRLWLAEQALPPISDVEGMAVAVDTSSLEGKPALRWCGPDTQESQVVYPSKIRAGDVLIVPADYGGCDEHGWSPRWCIPVMDVNESTALDESNPECWLRIHPALLAQALRTTRQESKLGMVWSSRIVDALIRERRSPSIQKLITTLIEQSDLPAIWRSQLEAFAKCSEVEITFPYDDDPESAAPSGALLKGMRRLQTDASCAPSPHTVVSDAACLGGVSVPVDARRRIVADCIENYICALGVPTSLEKILRCAALLHTEGPQSRNWQTYLRIGYHRGMRSASPLVRGSSRFCSPSRSAHAYRQAALPRGWRPEMLSLKHALADPRWRDAPDRQLVLWLIGTQQGYGRFLFPTPLPINEGQVSSTQEPADAQLLFDGLTWLQLAQAVHKRYSPWEIARYEGFLRLAIYRAVHWELMLHSAFHQPATSS